MKRLLAAFLLCFALAPAAAQAHFTTQGYSRITQDGTTVSYVLGLESEALFELADGDDRGALSAYLLPRVRVTSGGERCDGALKGMTPQRYSGESYLQLVLEYECASEAGPFAIRYAVPAENLATYELGGTSGTYAFDPDNLTLRVDAPGLADSAAKAFERLDQVLLLVLVLLGARRVREVAAFAVGHVVAMLGVVELPASLVEPLIAAAVVYLAVRLVLGAERGHPLLVAAASGLLHGFGAATLGTPIAATLLAQALLGAIVVGLLLALRRVNWPPVAQAAAGSGAAAIGLFWLSQQVLGG